jgi:hypothetical protein
VRSEVFKVPHHGSARFLGCVRAGGVAGC